MANSAGISRVTAGSALEAVMSSIKYALNSGDDINLAGFGSFKAVNRTARNGRSTGAVIKNKTAKISKFTAGKKLKDAVNCE